MNSHEHHTPKNKSEAIANNFSAQGKKSTGIQLTDNRPEAIAQRKLQRLINTSGKEQFRSFPVQRLAIQRYPEAMDDDTAKSLGRFYNEAYKDKEDADYTAGEIAEIKAGVFMLTDMNPEGMEANCIGWAQGEDRWIDTGSLYTWTRRDGYTATDPAAGDAQIILWGVKRREVNEEEEDDAEDTADENLWSIRHASVLLTHAEIASRSGEFGGFEEITVQALQAAGVPNPCWTSVGGMGIGAMVHPRNWLEGGAFGTALKGMKK